MAEVDPLWAILSTPEKERGGWDSDEFFESGRPEVAQVMGRAHELGYPSGRDRPSTSGVASGESREPWSSTSTLSSAWTSPTP